MPTVHFRQGTQTVVLPEAPTATVPAVIAELAEVLVSSQLASQDEVGELRLAVLNGNSWEEISQQTSEIQALGINDATIVGYAFGSGDFTYEPYA